MNDHFCGNGAEWTKLHPPIHILEIIPGGNEEEKVKTLEMMSRMGYEKVRGSHWVACKLFGPPKALQQLSKSAIGQEAQLPK